jgi:hypothetical protein
MCTLYRMLMLFMEHDKAVSHSNSLCGSENLTFEKSTFMLGQSTYLDGNCCANFMSFWN